MDWPRAKNILIIAFLGVNLLLGYRLWAGPVTAGGSPFRVTAREVREVTAQLRERGVVVTADIPRRAQPMPLLTVRNPATDPAMLVHRFLGAGAEVHSRDNVWVGVRDGEAVAVYLGGEVFYRRLPAPPGSPSGPPAVGGGPGDSGSTAMPGGTASGGSVPDASGPEVATPARAVQVAREFWAQHGGLPAGLEPDYQVPTDTGRYLVVFTCRSGAEWFFASRAMALVGRDGVEEAYAAWPTPDRPSGNPRPVLPATEALLRVAPLLAEKGAVVVEVQQGFYSPVYDAREWEAVPVWRVRLASGKVLYVNAYTGEVEGLEEPYPRQGQETRGLRPGAGDAGYTPGEMPRSRPG